MSELDELLTIEEALDQQYSTRLADYASFEPLQTQATQTIFAPTTTTTTTMSATQGLKIMPQLDSASRSGPDLSCATKDQSYYVLVLSLLPLWINLILILTLILLSFHRNFRATKVYDNCTKRNAHYVYYVEIRTGDSSTNYNRRRTTLTIDLFDEQGQMLARIAIPGYMIFGRLDTPVTALEDDRFFELRVTRFWLYRSIKFTKIKTIKISHNCMEHDARVMFYAMEVRSSDKETARTFFPVMSYISSYGATNKPNASFDAEPTGSISLIGGPVDDSTSLNDRLVLLDYCLLIHISLAMSVYMISQHCYVTRLETYVDSIYQGLGVGATIFVVVIGVALLFRFVIKKNYALQMASGYWAVAYYASYGGLLLLSTSFWIFGVVDDNRFRCSTHSKNLSVAIVMAVAELLILEALAYMVGWFYSLLCMPQREPLALLDDSMLQLTEPPPTSGAIAAAAPPPPPPPPTTPKSRSRSKEQQNTRSSSKHGSKRKTQPRSPALIGPPPPLPLPGGAYPGYAPINPIAMYKTVYDQQITSYQPQALSNPYQAASQDTGIPAYPFGAGRAMSPGGAGVGAAMPSVHTQVTQGTVGAPSPIKPTDKKPTSQDSTGSDYFHHVMKNKGNVRSISQYGELLKHKKLKDLAPKNAKTLNKQPPQ